MMDIEKFRKGFDELDINSLQESTVLFQKLVNLSRFDDGLTAMHCLNVGLLVKAGCESLYCLPIKNADSFTNKLTTEFNQFSLDEKVFGGVAHDIGKEGIDPALNSKVGDYTAEEMARMESHVLLGYQIITTEFSSLKLARYAALHHNNFHGSPFRSYPEVVSIAEGGEYILKLGKSLLLEMKGVAMLYAVIIKLADLIDSAAHLSKRNYGVGMDLRVVEKNIIDNEIGKCWSCSTEKLVPLLSHVVHHILQRAYELEKMRIKQ